MSKTFELSDQELKEFHSNGFIGPFSLYQEDEINEKWKTLRLNLLDRKSAVYDQSGAISASNNIANYDRHLDNEFLARHITRPEITHRVASILGENVLCWRTEFFPKYPGDEGTDWHQADTFANAGGEPQIVWKDDAKFGGTITVWTAFTDAKIDTGCLQFIPGTHTTMNYDESRRMIYDPERNNKLRKSGIERGFFGYNYQELQIDPDWKPDEAKAVSMEMKTGQFIIFWSTLMHASHPHSGKIDNMRLGYVSRFVPTTVHVYPGLDEIEEYGGKISLDKFGCVLVSGKNEYTHNKIIGETTNGYKF